MKTILRNKFIIYIFALAVLVPANADMNSKSGYDIVNGKVMMYVNVWGHVNNPGLIQVSSNVTLTEIISLAGGPKPGAKLNRIQLFRNGAEPNKNKKHTIDLEEFLSTGSRGTFVDVKPNDTYYIPQSVGSILFENIGAINTLMGILNLYLNISSQGSSASSE